MGKVVPVRDSREVAQIMRMCALSTSAPPFIYDNVVEFAVTALAEGGWPEAVVQHHVPDARERLNVWIRKMFPEKKENEIDEG